jgi:hypothetical protein
VTVLFAVVLAAGYIALWVIWRVFFRGVDMTGERGTGATEAEREPDDADARPGS